MPVWLVLSLGSRKGEVNHALHYTARGGMMMLMMMMTAMEGLLTPQGEGKKG